MNCLHSSYRAYASAYTRHSRRGVEGTFIRIEEYREIVIINPGCIELMAMGSRKEGLNGFLQVASAELPILDRAYEPLRIRFRMGR